MDTPVIRFPDNNEAPWPISDMEVEAPAPRSPKVPGQRTIVN